MNSQMIDYAPYWTRKFKKVALPMLSAGLAAALTLVVFVYPDVILAQEEPASSGVSGAAAEANQPTSAGSDATTPDLVTNDRVNRLTEGGLIERQAALSEGLLLMDRQLRQMQLVEQILGVYGPDALVEVAPGRYETFKDTPVGMRQEIQLLDLQIQLTQKRAELERAQAQQRDSTVPEVMAGGPMDISKETDLGGDVLLAGLVLEEIYGQIGNLNAVVRVAGRIVTVRSNDTLPTGQLIVAVGRDKLTVQLADGEIREFQVR